jgi:hypothetical protein
MEERSGKNGRGTGGRRAGRRFWRGCRSVRHFDRCCPFWRPAGCRGGKDRTTKARMSAHPDGVTGARGGKFWRPGDLARSGCLELGWLGCADNARSRRIAVCSVASCGNDQQGAQFVVVAQVGRLCFFPISCAPCAICRFDADSAASALNGDRTGTLASTSSTEVRQRAEQGDWSLKCRMTEFVALPRDKNPAPFDGLLPRAWRAHEGTNAAGGHSAEQC